MKISNIAATPLRIPLKTPFKLSSFTVHFMHYVVIEVETDEGIVGFGEATPSWDVNGETMESVVGFIRLLKAPDMLGYSLLGEKLDTLADVERLMTTVIDPPDRFALMAGNSSAKAALEQALLHAVSQKTEASAVELLGGNHCPVPFSTTIGILPPEETLLRVSAALKAASPIVRLKIGCRDIFGISGFERDVQVIKEAKALIRKSQCSVKLVADANQGFVDERTAISFCRAIEGCLDWLEQPLLASNIAGFLAVRNETGVPLMADESLSSFKDAERFFEKGGSDYFNIKLMKTGGIYGALRLIDTAAEYGVKCHIGSMIESAFGILPGIAVAMLRDSQIAGSDLNVFDELSGQYSVVPRTIGNTIEVSDMDFRQRIDRERFSEYVFAYDARQQHLEESPG